MSLRMKNVMLMGTEIGRVPIVVNKTKEKGITVYIGQILNSNSIHIQSLSEEKCILELKKAFELQISFWLRNQLADLNITYGAVNKKYPNQSKN